MLCAPRDFRMRAEQFALQEQQRNVGHEASSMERRLCGNNGVG